MNVRQELIRQLGNDPRIQLNDIDLDPSRIKALMINEVVPADPAQDFYGSSGEEYLSTAIPMFQLAGLPAEDIRDILDMGVYITNAVKLPKETSAVDPSAIEASLPWLEAEISLFPDVQVIMLMGDVAKKMYNTIARKTLKRSVIPSGATYRLRANAYYHGSIRVMPSYIMTGKNLLIEKSKIRMAAQDIAVMAELIRQ